MAALYTVGGRAGGRSRLLLPLRAGPPRVQLAHSLQRNRRWTVDAHGASRRRRPTGGNPSPNPNPVPNPQPQPQPQPNDQREDQHDNAPRAEQGTTEEATADVTEDDSGAGPLSSDRLAVSGWFTTTDEARAVGVESAVVSLQPCEATTPLFNT